MVDYRAADPGRRPSPPRREENHHEGAATLTTMKALLLSTAIATFAAIGTAAAQPFDMSRDQADRVTAGSGGDFNVRVFKSVQEQKLKLTEILTLVKQQVELKGNFANAEAAATAKGRNT